MAETKKPWTDLLAAFDQYVKTQKFPGRLQLAHSIFRVVESKSKDPRWVALPSVALDIACLIRKFQLEKQDEENTPDDDDDWLRDFRRDNNAVDLPLSMKQAKFIHGIIRSQMKPVAEHPFITKQAYQKIQTPGQGTRPHLLVYQLGLDQIAFVLNSKGNPQDLLLLLKEEPTTKLVTEATRRVKCEFAKLFWITAPLGVSFIQEDRDDHWKPEPRDLTINDFVEDPQEEGQQKKLRHRIDRFYKKQQYIGVLLQGVPGVGKSFFARSLCNSILSCSRMVHVPRDVYLHYIEDYISWLQPDVMVIDDIDRDVHQGKYFLEFLETSKREGTYKGLVVIASVNNIKQLDSALLRPGRFDEVYTMKMPAPAFRKALLEAFSRDQNWSDRQVETLVGLSEGMTPAEIHKLARTLNVLSDPAGNWSDEDAQIEADRIREQSNYYNQGGSDSDRCVEIDL